MSEKNLNFKLLVFDWDGTLMDSAPRIVASFQTAITELGLEKRSNAQIRHIIGLGLETAIATLFPGESPQHCVQLSERYRHHFLSNQALATPLFPGVAETLHTLHAAGYWLAVATSKSRKGLNRALAESHLTSVFHSSRTADETCSKPNPQMLQEIMDELCILPTDTVMIGDTEYDLQMAQNAGTASVAVSYGVHDKALLLACNPLICINELPALSAWLHSAQGTPCTIIGNKPDVRDTIG
jgi:phosphoglycolate phosphatase